MKKTIHANVWKYIGIAVICLILGYFIGHHGATTTTPDTQAGMNAGGTRGGMRGNRAGGFTTGEVIAKDAQSITIKMRDGSSKILFYSAKTDVLKSTAGTSDDVAVGSQIMANGTANQDGSMTAQSIQIRPAMPPTQAPIAPGTTQN